MRVYCRDLSASATNLAGRVLGWRGVVSCFRNAIKGVACAQALVRLGMQLKDPVYKKVVYTYVSLSFSAL